MSIDRAAAGLFLFLGLATSGPAANYHTHGLSAQRKSHHPWFVYGAMLADLDKHGLAARERTHSAGDAFAMAQQAQTWGSWGNDRGLMFARGWAFHNAQDNLFAAQAAAVPGYSSTEVRLGFDFFSQIMPSSTGLNPIVLLFEPGWGTIKLIASRYGRWNFTVAWEILRYQYGLVGLTAQRAAARLYGSYASFRLPALILPYLRYLAGCSTASVSWGPHSIVR